MSSPGPQVSSERGDARIDGAERARAPSPDAGESSRSLRDIEARGFVEAHPDDEDIYIVRCDRIWQAACEAGMTAEEFMASCPDARPGDSPRNR
jgi:hypothetical protein